MPKPKRSRPAASDARNSALVPAGIFKAKCLELIDTVKESGVEFVITKHGKPFARLAPVDAAHAGTSPIGFMRGTVLHYGDIVTPDPDAWEQSPTDPLGER